MNAEVSQILLTDYDAKQVVINAFPKIIVDYETQAIVWSNRKAEELFECPYIGEMIGERFDILMPERKRGIHGPHWEQFWLAPVPRMMTTAPLDCRKRDGSEFKAQILLAPCKSGIRVSCLVQFVPQ